MAPDPEITPQQRRIGPQGAGSKLEASLCLGLIGGLGVAATIHYYRELVSEHALRGRVPNLVIAHADLNRVLRDAAAGHTLALAHYLADLIHRLSLAGATFAVIPSVTPHICAAELFELSPIPFVSLPAEILRDIQLRQVKRVALIGTRFTIETDMFGQLSGVEIVKPTPIEIDAIHETYVQLAKDGAGSAEQYDRLRRIAHTLCERDGVDAIVLAGTDLSLLFNPTNTDFPHIDGARVHIAAIMRRLFEEPD
jgi:aspartate racemase